MQPNGPSKRDQVAFGVALCGQAAGLGSCRRDAGTVKLLKSNEKICKDQGFRNPNIFSFAFSI